jgi:hypothetical protein
MYQRVPPFNVIFFIHIKVEHFQEGVVRECPNGHPSVEQACIAQLKNRPKGDSGMPLTTTILDPQLVLTTCDAISRAWGLNGRHQWGGGGQMVGRDIALLRERNTVGIGARRNKD